jgi:hypothetical protein
MLGEYEFVHAFALLHRGDSDFSKTTPESGPPRVTPRRNAGARASPE